jgi:hypothetical protein
VRARDRARGPIDRTITKVTKTNTKVTKTNTKVTKTWTDIRGPGGRSSNGLAFVAFASPFVTIVIVDRGESMKLIAVLVASVGVLAGSVWAQSGGNSVAKDSRVFEMRTYYAAPGKLEDLQARFRNHTTKLFEKHGMTNIGYWVPVDEKTGQPSGNTLVYILAYPGLEARQKSWDGFRNDPAWTAARTESEKNGKLIEKIDSVFLKPTDYSPMK